MSEQAQWVTVAKAAPALDMNTDQVYRAIRENQFPFRFVRLGKLIRIDARAIGLAPAPPAPPAPHDQPAEASASAA